MLTGKTIRALRAIVGAEHVRTAEADRVLYGLDATPVAPLAVPEAVVLPGTAEEVAEIVRLANRARFPVVPRGAGTNLTGGARPIRGGVVLSTQRLNRILEIDRANMQAVVQPGVVTEDLQEAALALGLFYPPDPQSQEVCTLGGNLAENAGGPRAVKYGVTRQYVLSIEAVLPEGDRVRLGARTIKSVAGYDLVSLLCGSEGTLGIITEATLRLLPRPEASGTLLGVFDDLGRAAGGVVALLQAGVIPSALEFVDRATIGCIEAFRPVGLPREAQAALVIEVDGRPGDVADALGRVESVLAAAGAVLVRRAADAREAAELWQARRAAGPALAHLKPLKFNEDIVVPIGRLPEAIAGVHAIGARHRVTCACFGHAGDGNIHVNFLASPGDPDELTRIEAAVAETFALAVELGGSITGEHGVGTTKQPFLGLEIGPRALRAMRRIKAALDPNGVMNPGKIFPEEGAHGSAD